MKQRFVSNKSGASNRNLIVSIIVFFIIFGCFWFGISSFSNKASDQEKQTLETAVNRGIAHCYAIEGAYPESLQYLKEHYGLIYDEDRFFIDYQILGSNIMPDVTIIDKEDGQ